MSASAAPGVNAPSASSQISPAHGMLAKTRALDGDYKTPSIMSSHVKDSDGDYKALAASSAAQSSSAVQTTLTVLKKGG